MSTKRINQLTAGTQVTDTSFFADEDSSNSNDTQKLSALDIYTYLLTKYAATPIGSNSGGTGVASPTAHGILLAQGSSPMTGLALTDGEIPIGSTGNDPVAANITAGTGITITNAPGSITISANSSENLPIVNVSTISKTFALSDGDTYQVCSSASSQTLTIPTNASVAFPVGTEIYVQQAGAGVVSVVGAGGVTINSPYSSQIILAQGCEAKLKKTDTNTWIFIPYASQLGTDATLLTSDFTIPNSSVIQPPKTWVLASGSANDITITLPSNPSRGETHRFIVRNIGFNTTIVAAGLFDIVGNLITNVTGVAHISDLTSVSSLSVFNTGINNQVLEVTMDGSHWVLFHNIGFTN